VFGVVLSRGDGFVTDADLIRNMRLDDPRPFFKELLTKTYRKRTILSPHFYGMTVTNNTHTGHQLWEMFTKSWGKLQVHSLLLQPLRSSQPCHCAKLQARVATDILFFPYHNVHHYFIVDHYCLLCAHMLYAPVCATVLANY
jgi:hypothetical protein